MAEEMPDVENKLIQFDSQNELVGDLGNLRIMCVRVCACARARALCMCVYVRECLSVCVCKSVCI